MKFILFICTVLLSSQALAHVDHALGDGELHLAYHVIFFVLLALVAYKAGGWLKVKMAKSKD